MLLSPGARFAEYVVRAPLGRGGSSEVYLAEDPERSRAVALKILSGADGRSEVARGRFRDEFDIAHALHHPHIVQVYAHGESEGLLWLATEYVDGVTASALAPAPHKSPDLALALNVLAGIAEGLDYAHARGVAHLDVKPSNILVGHGDPRTVMLTDFGTARRWEEVEPVAPGGFVVGSIPYAAPELLRGEKLYPATDQYSLACSAVELLTGHPPFLRSTRFALAEAQLHKHPPDVSWRRHWIPHAVDSILDKSLAKDPFARYATCAEPIRLIAHALRGIEPSE
ncbi:serine/threonine protein kinase [Nocardia sp. NBC_01730]|uniref:serine/threonine-protein kinase n=1 Tax=Nocardia sp. NBC_01730 TaxID=2975998 RepID=UPI002E104C98|nr:serine/threonine protein kinase [Nocardia sp. NBC_01730]